MGSNTSDSSVSQADAGKLRLAFEGLGQNLFFQVRSTTKLRKVAEIFAAHINNDVETIRFSLDGRPISTDSTPESCGMVEGDRIDVTTKSDGGGFNA